MSKTDRFDEKESAPCPICGKPCLLENRSQTQRAELSIKTVTALLLSKGEHDALPDYSHQSGRRSARALSKLVHALQHVQRGRSQLQRTSSGRKPQDVARPLLRRQLHAGEEPCR
jgi:hypothetical protein